jgi:hypothetical protein
MNLRRQADDEKHVFHTFCHIQDHDHDHDQDQCYLESQGAVDDEGGGILGMSLAQPQTQVVADAGRYSAELHDDEDCGAVLHDNDNSPSEAHVEDLDHDDDDDDCCLIPLLGGLSDSLACVRDANANANDIRDGFKKNSKIYSCLLIPAQVGMRVRVDCQIV